MKIDLTVGGAEFWARLREDIRGARHSVRVQTLSMEGDAAGLGLAEELERAAAPDRRLLIDEYTRYIISDRFLFSPTVLWNRPLRDEAARTRRMVEEMRSAGVGVRFTNPPGFMLRRIAARDHKKLALVDGRIAYLGGINFSDHNFAWHDMMFRFEDEALCRFLEEDFDRTWAGEKQNRSARFGPVEVHLLDGRKSDRGFETIFAAIDAAEREIWVHSPYLSFPFVDRLGEAAARGVRVNVISPERNNYATLKEYLVWRAAELGMTMWMYPERMLHLKAMLIDDGTLIMGSANFDWLGFSHCQEVVALVRDPGAIAQFRSRVLEPDLAASTRHPGGGSAVRGRLAEAQVRFAARALGKLAGG